MHWLGCVASWPKRHRQDAAPQTDHARTRTTPTRRSHVRRRCLHTSRHRPEGYRWRHRRAQSRATVALVARDRAATPVFSAAVVSSRQIEPPHSDLRSSSTQHGRAAIVVTTIDNAHVRATTRRCRARTRFAACPTDTDNTATTERHWLAHPCALRRPTLTPARVTRAAIVGDGHEHRRRTW